MKYSGQIMHDAAAECLLCTYGACQKACPEGYHIADLLRSVRFRNEEVAAISLGTVSPCKDCDRDCEKACRRGVIDRPVNIREFMESLGEMYDSDVKQTDETSDPDLSIDFLGFRCVNPFFLSSSVVGSNYEMISKAFDLGWGGVVYKTITSFPHKEVSPRFDVEYDSPSSFIGFKNLEESSEHTIEENKNILSSLKRDHPDRMVIASIMGQNEDDWTYLAEQMTEAGVDALELNFSCPHMAYDGLGSDVGVDPDLVERYVKAVKRGTDLPVIAKMTAQATSIIPPSMAAVRGGAVSLAAINTLKSILDIDTEDFSSGPDIAGKTAVGGFSGKAVKPLALKAIYDMASFSGLKGVELSGIGGIESWRDCLDFIALGCVNIQVTTAIMQYGYRIIIDMISGMRHFMKKKNISSVSELVGCALGNIVRPEDLDRHSIVYPRIVRKNCIGCGRCVLSCYDGGHQALEMKDDGRVVMDPVKCVGCHLCIKVCPCGAIEKGVRVDKK